MERTIPVAVLSDLNQPASAVALICFATITHPNLPDPARVVCDPLPYIWGGETYSGIVFEFKILSDDDNPPFTEITLPNIDRRVANAVRRSRERAKIDLALIASTEFDLSANPRTEIATATPTYAFEGFEIVDVDVDVLQIRGRVQLRDFAAEPWPGLSATQTRLPGLFV